MSGNFAGETDDVTEYSLTFISKFGVPSISTDIGANHMWVFQGSMHTFRRNFWNCGTVIYEIPENRMFPTIGKWLMYGVARKWHSSTSPITPPILEGVKKCEIWPQFSTPVAFEAL